MDVKRLLHRRSLPREGNNDGAEKPSWFRRSRSRPRQAQVAAPQDDPLTKAYTHAPSNSYSPELDGKTAANNPQSHSRSRTSGPAPSQPLDETYQNGMPKDETLPGQAITIDADYDNTSHMGIRRVRGSSNTSAPEEQPGRSHKLLRHKTIYTHPEQGLSSSSRFSEDTAALNVKRNNGIPPIPPLPQSPNYGSPRIGQSSSPNLSTYPSNFSYKVSDPYGTQPRQGQTMPDSHPIASEVRTLSLTSVKGRTKRKSKFSSASYYMRQSSPPPSFSQATPV